VARRGRPPSARRRELSRGEVLLAALGACVLAIVMTWPLVLHLGTHVPRDLGDPLAQSWQPAWGGHALLHQPLDFFQANQFWPARDSLAFSDALVGYAPAGLIGSGPEAAVARYDLLFMFAYALAFFGAYLLARELGLGPAGAAVAGAAFAFAPFRLEQDGHLQVVTSGGIPLCAALGVRGIRLRRPGWLIAAWLAAAWQLSIGFTLGLPLAYLLVGGTVAAVAVWLRRGRPPLDRRLVRGAAIGAVLFLFVGAILARPYFRVAHDNPQVHRSHHVVEGFSGPITVFLTAPEENLVWGEATGSIRDGFENISEKTLFPGLAIVVLAAIGLGSSTLPKRLRIGLGIWVVVFSVLALGFQETGSFLWPYRIVYEVLPGWKGVRTPGRLVTFSSLGLALLAAAGAESVLRSLAGRGWRPALGAAVAALLVLAIVVEGRGLPFDPTDSQAQPRVPPVPPSTAALPQPQLNLPATRDSDNRRYLLWSTNGFPKMVNGKSSNAPTVFDETVAKTAGFPDRESVDYLRALGVRTVILHLRRVPGSPQAHAASRPIAGLGLTRTRRGGDLIVYEIRSAPSASAGSADAG
jgi:hypothetical protein